MLISIFYHSVPPVENSMSCRVLCELKLNNVFHIIKNAILEGPNLEDWGANFKELFLVQDVSSVFSKRANVPCGHFMQQYLIPLRFCNYLEKLHTSIRRLHFSSGPNCTGASIPLRPPAKSSSLSMIYCKWEVCCWSPCSQRANHACINKIKNHIWISAVGVWRRRCLLTAIRSMGHWPPMLSTWA